MPAAPLDLVDLMRAPFVLGGRTPAVGLDCWGFVVEVRRRLALDTPDPIAGTGDIAAAADCANGMFADAWQAVPMGGPLAPGDVIVLPGEHGARTHAAVYLGGQPPQAAHFNRHGGQLVAWARLRRFARDCWRYPATVTA